MKLNRILLIATREVARTSAFERAVALASASGATLHFMTLMDTGASSDGAAIRSIVAQVLDRVSDDNADMVIKDARTGFVSDPAFDRSINRLLLRECPAYLHLVANTANPKPARILAALDLSHLEELSWGLNDHILRLASTLAASCDATLHMINVGNWAILGTAGKSVATSTLHCSLRDAITDLQSEAFEELAERYKIDKNRRHVFQGAPEQVIVHFARQKAFDMLVLGKTFLHGDEQLIGNSAEGVLERVPGGVMFVR